MAVTSVSEFFHSNAWLGACTSISGVIGGQLVGLLAYRYYMASQLNFYAHTSDIVYRESSSLIHFFRIQRKFKLLLIVLLTIATLLAFWFAVSVYGFTSKNAVNIFISLCLQYFFAYATSPLYFEAAVEVTYLSLIHI